MKRLYLLRHAKSSWDDPLPDHERPLAPRGRRAAKLMGEHLREERIRPALVLCSSSVRTRETLSRIAKAVGDEPPVEFEQGLYGAGAEQLLERLRQLSADVPSVLLIGHNPGMHELALGLAGSGAQLARLEEKFPTAALATLDFELDTWDELEPGSGELVAYVVPRELG